MKLFRTVQMPVGSSPGTIAPPAEALEPRCHVIDFTATELVEADESDFGELEEIFSRDSVTWLDVQGLGDRRLIGEIGRTLSLHELLLEDIANVPQRPKLVVDEDKLLLVTRMVSMRDGELDREQVSVLVGPRFVVTFQERYGDTLDPVRKRLRAAKGIIRKSGPDYLAYALVDCLVDGYFPVLETLGDELESLEDEILSDPQPELLRRVARAKNTLLVLRRCVWPTREALSHVLRDSHELIQPQSLPYFRDLLDMATQAVELAESMRELAGGAQNSYLTAAGNRMNEIMKVLTIMASIFIPLTFMAGIYGMNFQSMPELALPWAYPALLGLMAVTSLGMVVFFVRRGWITLFRSDRSRRRSSES